MLLHTIEVRFMAQGSEAILPTELTIPLVATILDTTAMSNTEHLLEYPMHTRKYRAFSFRTVNHRSGDDVVRHVIK